MDVASPSSLEEYYKRLFPVNYMMRWLGYGPGEAQKVYFQRREFSFTLQDDVYLRYQSFDEPSKFKDELVRRKPVKIDIGAVYNQIPKDSKNWLHGAASQVEERELVFDIDMTDYDDVRFCCTGASICDKCWTLMRFAIQIVDQALEEDFGFEFRLWVFSGRRGVHCWVSDEAARTLNSQARATIAEYLTLVKGGENKSKKVNLNFNMHPSVKRAAKVIQRGFDDYACKQQDFLGDEARITKFLSILPPECRDEFGERMRRGKDSTERWILFQTHLKQFSNKKIKLSPNLTEEIMFQYCYPRLDVEVTKGMNHLLKSPFCIHPKTGMVCVPINLDKLDSFKPLEVPTIEKLCSELETINMINLDKKIKDYKETSMRPYVELLINHVEKMESKLKGKNLIKSDMACEW